MATTGGLRRYGAFRTTACFVACALMLGLAAGTAAAEEPGADEKSAGGEEMLRRQLKEWKASVKSHKKKKHFPLLQKDLEAAIKLYKAAESADEIRADLIDAVGALSKGGRGSDRIIEVIRTLADMGDVRGGKYIRPFLRQGNPKQASDVLREAVAAAADVPDQGLVEPLLKIVDRSKTLGIAGDAVDALGRFHGVKNKRVKILDTLIRTTKRSRPGAQPRMNSGRQGIDGSGEEAGPMGRQSGGSARWSMLTSAVPAALNMLTGQDFRTYDEWFTVWKSRKSDLKSLFIKEEEG